MDPLHQQKQRRQKIEASDWGARSLIMSKAEGLEKREAVFTGAHIKELVGKNETIRQFIRAI